MLAKRIATLFGVSMFVLGGMLGTAATASAALTLITCAGGEIEIYIDEDNGNLATVEGFLEDCTSPGHPNIDSATITGSGLATVNTAALLETTTADTIEWNTGQTTTVTSLREFAGIGIVVMVGEDATVNGLLHPAAGVEEAPASRTSNPGGAVAFADFADGVPGRWTFTETG